MLEFLEQYVVFLLIGGALLILAALDLNTKYHEKQRREAVERIADSLGYIYEAQSTSLKQRFGKKPELLPRQRTGKLLNILHGEIRRAPFMVFDYRFTTGSGRSRRLHNQTCFAIEVEGLDLPEFSVRQRTWRHRTFGWLSKGVVPVSYHAEFERRFMLRYAGDPARLEDDLPAAFFDQTLDFERLELTWNGRWLAIANARQRVEPDSASYEQFIERCSNLSRILMDN